MAKSETLPSSAASDSKTTSDGNAENYVVVARRYRPRGFDELVGQQHVGQALKNAIETNRVGHAYLFTGARGVGKTSTARIFAKGLNDPAGPTATPDNQSDVAIAIDSGEDVDVIEIDGASNRGIDEIRSLRANIGVRPSRARYKIYIIDEVHMLTTPAFNALLKTLEEPPEHVKFIFCTTDPEKIPITVLSRCQRFDFAPVELQKIVERLRFIVDSESAEAEEAALELIARRAAGSMRDSQSLLEQVLSFSSGKLTAPQVHAMLGTADDERLHALAMALADRDAAAALKQLDAGIDAGVDAGRLAEQLLGYFRDLMAVAVGCDAAMLRHASASMYQPLKQLAEDWGLQTVLAVVSLIDQTLVRIRHSVHARVLLESTLIQICNLPDLQQIADLAAASADFNSSKRSLSASAKSKSAGAVITQAGQPVGEKKKSGAPGDLEKPLNLPPNPKPPEAGGDSIGKSQSTTMHRADASSPATPHFSGSRGGDSETVASTNRTETEQNKGDSLVGSSVQSATAVAELVPKVKSPSGQQASTENAPGKTVTQLAASTDVSDSGVDSVHSPSVPWNQQAAETAWRRALDNLESMTETFAKVVRGVRAEGTNTLRLTFPHDGALAKRRCELPEHKNALGQAVSNAAGQEIILDFAIAQAPTEQKTAEPAQNKPSRMQRMREIEANDLVKACVELFDAEIVRIEKPKDINGSMRPRT